LGADEEVAGDNDGGGTEGEGEAVNGGFSFDGIGKGN
jgi:hypothetical protein